MLSKISSGTSGGGLVYDSSSFMFPLLVELLLLRPSNAKPSKTKRFKYLPKNVSIVGVFDDVTLSSCLILSALSCTRNSYDFWFSFAISEDIFVFNTFDDCARGGPVFD